MKTENQLIQEAYANMFESRKELHDDFDEWKDAIHGYTLTNTNSDDINDKPEKHIASDFYGKTVGEFDHVTKTGWVKTK